MERQYTIACYDDHIIVIIVVVIDEAGSQLHRHLSPQLSMQAYEVADDDGITDLLLTGGQTERKPAVLETAERGTHVAVCSFFSVCIQSFLTFATLGLATYNSLFRLLPINFCNIVGVGKVIAFFSLNFCLLKTFLNTECGTENFHF